jgi:hypothetical protein
VNPRSFRKIVWLGLFASFAAACAGSALAPPFAPAYAMAFIATLFLAGCLFRLDFIARGTAADRKRQQPSE